MLLGQVIIYLLPPPRHVANISFSCSSNFGLLLCFALTSLVPSETSYSVR